MKPIRTSLILILLAICGDVLGAEVLNSIPFAFKENTYQYYEMRDGYLARLGGKRTTYLNAGNFYRNHKGSNQYTVVSNGSGYYLMDIHGNEGDYVGRKAYGVTMISDAFIIEHRDGHRQIMRRDGSVRELPADHGEITYTSIFVNGFCVAKAANGKYGVINSDGQWMLAPRYDHLYRPLDGLFAAKKLGKWGFIDVMGNWVVAPALTYPTVFYKVGNYLWIKDAHGYAFVSMTDPSDRINAEGCMGGDKDITFFKRGGKYARRGKGATTITGFIYDDVVTIQTDPTVSLCSRDGKYYLVDAEGCEEPVESYEDAASHAENAYLNTASPLGYNLRQFLSLTPGDWNLFSLRNHLDKPDIPTADELKADIRLKLDQWKQKGEFEKTDAWQERVNERTYAAKADELSRQATAELAKKVDDYNASVRALSKSYAKKRNLSIGVYCRGRGKEFGKRTMTLGRYDADNETYLISVDGVGDLLLPVPLDIAPGFKQNWANVSRSAVATYVPSGDDVALSGVTFTLDGREFVYDSKTEARYALTDVDYSFAPVEISVPDAASLASLAADFSAPAVATAPTAQVTPVTTHKVEPERRRIEVGSVGASDVDTDIPTCHSRADKTFALIIANEHYRREAHVPHALNDGTVMARYIEQTLGLPKENIHVLTDASLGDIKFGMGKLAKICRAYEGEASVLVYYAGHGIPDDSSRDAYILPADGYGSDVSTAYPLSDFYSALADMPSRKTIVMLDACFSGAERSGNMIRSARGVRIKPRDTAPSGNVVVLSATMNDETAYSYEEKKHGLFTYFILKKLRESKGGCTLGELADYVRTNVMRQSAITNDRAQTPSVLHSPSATAWQRLTLR